MTDTTIAGQVKLSTNPLTTDNSEKQHTNQLLSFKTSQSLQNLALRYILIISYCPILIRLQGILMVTVIMTFPHKIQTRSTHLKRPRRFCQILIIHYHRQLEQVNITTKSFHNTRNNFPKCRPKTRENGQDSGEKSRF